MDMYVSEEERVEALKRWWKENRNSLLIGLLLGLLVVSGWRYWQAQQQAQHEEASLIFHRLSEAALIRQPLEAQKLAERLIEGYGSTTYAEFARLSLAKFKVVSGDLEAAKLRLEEELRLGKNEALKDLARLRLARVLLARGEYAQGLELLGQSKGESSQFDGLLQEVRGDLLRGEKRLEEARAAYLAAKEKENRSPLLDLKIHDLPPAHR